ncbi:MAG: hypothetical protein J6B71_04220, partial [Clostridia bacterium]|nr:hypothetical protein [Clostridia bacterium]
MNTVVGHEVTHVLEGTETYNELQKAVFKYAKSKGEFDSRRKNLEKLYSEEDIDSELTADLIGDYLFQDADFVKNLSVKNRNLFQKLFDEIKYLCKVATAGSKEARELERIKREFEKAYRESVKTDGKAQSDAKFSLDKNWDKSYNYTATNAFVQEVTHGDRHTFARSLANKTSGIVDGDTKTVQIYCRDKVYTFVANGYMQGYVSMSEDVDVIEARKRRFKEYHENDFDTDREVVSLWSKPISDQSGGQANDVSISSRRRRSAFDDSLPKDTSGSTREGNNERVRENTYSQKEIDKIVNKLREMYGLDAKKSNGTFGETKSDDIAPIKETSSTDGVFFDGNNPHFSLSSDSEGKKLTKEQSDYFKDSKVRDENGNLKVMYHGTPNGDFTVFKDGTYFTENKWYADLYQNPGASSISTGKVATNPKTFEVYLDIKKPFDISDPEARSIYINDYIKGGNAVGINPYLSDAEYNKIGAIDWTEGEDLRDFLIDNGYDYDGLVLDEGAVGGYGDEVKQRGKSYVVFSPEQVKNVDNVKPTSDPDIRYSLSRDGDDPIRLRGYGAMSDTYLAPIQENIAPVREDISKTETTNPTVSNLEQVEIPIITTKQKLKEKQRHKKNPRKAFFGKFFRGVGGGHF